MNTSFPSLERAIEAIGLNTLAAELKVTPQAVRKWQLAGRLPRTEWTGETNYATRIVELMRARGKKMARQSLLQRPAPAQDAPEASPLAAA